MAFRLPDYYIDSNGLPSILNTKQQQIGITTSTKRPPTRAINKTKSGHKNKSTKPNRQDGADGHLNEMDTTIGRPNSNEIKNLILTAHHHAGTDVGLNKKLKCKYNEMKKKQMEAKAAQLKDQMVTTHCNEDNLR